MRGSIPKIFLKPPYIKTAWRCYCCCVVLCCVVLFCAVLCHWGHEDQWEDRLRPSAVPLRPHLLLHPRGTFFEGLTAHERSTGISKVWEQTARVI